MSAAPAATFMMMNVLPALGFREVTIIVLHLSPFPAIMSMLVLSTRKASLTESLLPLLTMIRQLDVSNLSFFFSLDNPLLLSSPMSGISPRKGTLDFSMSFLHLTEVSVIFNIKDIPKGIPHPRIIATRRTIILLGDTGDGDPLGDMMSLVFPTFTSPAISFSSRFWRR